MLGQLQDAGNTTTLAHYLELLGDAGLLAGLQKFSGPRARPRRAHMDAGGTLRGTAEPL